MQGTSSASDPPLAKVPVLKPKPLTMHGMPKTGRTSCGTWNNISLMPEYLLMNK